MIQRLYHIRFELFLFTQVTILFGALFVPVGVFENVIAPLLFLINLLTGLLLVSKNRGLLIFCVLLLVISSGIFGVDNLNARHSKVYLITRIVCYFLFYTLVALQIIKDIWRSEMVNKAVIFGLISGYISLGLIGSFLFMFVAWIEPGSFTGGLLEQSAMMGQELFEQLLYFSFITLMTIGYGDITPATTLGQKATLVVGLMGQFYLVIITAVVVGKYIANSKSNTPSKE